MTVSKKDEIKLFARLQALYSRLNQINGDLIRLEAEIESVPTFSVTWEGSPESIVAASQAETDQTVRKLFLSILKGKLTAERESVEKQIAEI